MEGSKLKPREIKFRVWSTKENKWMFGYEYPNLGGFSLIGETVLMGEFSKYSYDKYVNDFVYEEFTGRKDKKGVEIYEGDIVNGGCYNGSYRLGIIRYIKGSFVAIPIGFLAEGVIEPLYFECLDIVGNIHDNPELLK